MPAVFANDVLRTGPHRRDAQDNKKDTKQMQEDVVMYLKILVFLIFGRQTLIGIRRDFAYYTYMY